MDITEAFKQFLVNGNGKNKVVKKSLPVKKEWLTRLKEMVALEKEVDEKENKLDALRNHFWSEVKLELSDYSEMRFNPKSNEIEIMTNKEDGAIPSPFAK